MGGRILNCSISLLLLLLLAAPLQAQSSTSRDNLPRAEKKKEKKKPEVEYPLYNGVIVGVDLWGLGSGLLGSDFTSAEVSVNADLKHRYFPVAEVGFGKTDSWNDNGIHYKGNGPYARIGLDYNTLYNKRHGHMLMVGLRYGFSNFKYDVRSAVLDDPIYGGEMGNPNIVDDVWKENIPYDHHMKGTMQWAEFCVGIRAHIWKELYMGWALRFKFSLSESFDKYGDPWYVPGFGKYGSSTLGVSYTISYKLPF